MTNLIHVSIDNMGYFPYMYSPTTIRTRLHVSHRCCQYAATGSVRMQPPSWKSSWHIGILPRWRDLRVHCMATYAVYRRTVKLREPRSKLTHRVWISGWGHVRCCLVRDAVMGRCASWKIEEYHVSETRQSQYYAFILHSAVLTDVFDSDISITYDEDDRLYQDRTSRISETSRREQKHATVQTRSTLFTWLLLPHVNRPKVPLYIPQGPFTFKGQDMLICKSWQFMSPSPEQGATLEKARQGRSSARERRCVTAPRTIS
jgi:hypothetical protein